MSQYSHPGLKAGLMGVACLVVSMKTEERFSFLHPRHWLYRYIILSLLCYNRFITYYAYETPTGLEEIIIRVLGIDTTKYSLLFSLAFLPSAVLCFIGGIFINQYLGIRLGYVLTVALALLGQSIVAVGTFINYYWLVLVGRSLLGITTDFIIILNSAFEVIWFKHRLSFAVSIDNAASKIADFVAAAFSNLLYANFGFISNSLHRLSATYFIGVCGLVLALIGSLIVVGMDVRGEKLLDQERTKQKKENRDRCCNIFSVNLWLTVVVIALVFPSIFSFLTIGQGFYMFKYNLPISKASIANSLIFSTTIIGTPIMGALIDTVGYNGTWAMAGVLLATGTHLLLMLSNGLSYLPYISGMMYSIAYTLWYPAIFPLIAVLVNEKQVTTAYGFTFSILSVVYAVLAVITGVLVDYSGYMILELCFILIHCLVILLMGALLLNDALSKDPRVNISSRERRRKKELVIVNGHPKNEKDPLI